ncbi:MAG: hypothetical protein ACLQIB_10230 [Isosphaeraceae bacterium]
MAGDDRDIHAENRPVTPLESIRMDKRGLSVVSLYAESDEKEFWRTQSPTARLEALELMRQVVYGYNPISDRLERVLEVIKRTPQ